MAILAAFLLCAIAALCGGCEEPPQKDVKSRLPVMPGKTLGPVVQAPAPTEEPKEDRPQHTNMGTIVNAIVKQQTTLNSQGWYLSFTFQEDGGFQKEFFPVCDGQVLQMGHVAIMYHWHRWELSPSDTNRNSIGCYMIDGYQTK